LFGPDLVSASMKRVLHESVWRDDVKVLGVDVARFGDDRSVLALRQGRVAHQPVILRNLDTMQLAGRIALYIEEHQPDGVFIDQATFGAGVLDVLILLDVNDIGIDVGGTSADPRYPNMRPQMCVHFSE